MKNSDKKNRLIYEKLKQSFLKNVSHSAEVFFPMAHDVLFERADKAESNTQQIRFFDAISTLNKVKEPLKIKFIHLIEQQLNDFSNEVFHEKKSDSLDELDLIDLNEFEHWLEINKIVIKISPHYEQELLEIELRLDELLGKSEDDSELAPFFPENIFNCFSEAIYAHFLGNDIILLLIHQFEKVMNNNFFDLYKEINQIFIANNILPVIEKKKLRIVKAISSSDDSSIPTLEVKTTSEQSQQTSKTHQISSETRTASTTNPVISTALININTEHMTEVATLENNINLAPGYQTLKDLFNFQNGQGFNKIPDEFYASEDYQRQLSLFVDELSLLQIDQAARVQAGNLTPVNLKTLDSLVKTSMNSENYSIELHNEFQYTLDVVQRLFRFIERDSWLDNPIKKLLLLLELPLLKVSLLQKDFFESWSNPLRIVINKLAILEFYDESMTRLGRYFVRLHTGLFAPYDCEDFIATHLIEIPDVAVGCEESIGTTFGWRTD